MKAIVNFAGTLGEFLEFCKTAEGNSKIEATLTIEKNVKTLNELCREAAVPFILKGKKIEAIKAVRAISGMGLTDAKNFVEAMPESSMKG